MTCQSRLTGAPHMLAAQQACPVASTSRPCRAERGRCGTRRSVAKVRDFIEIVFVKKRFYSADALVPSSLGRLPVRSQ